MSESITEELAEIKQKCQLEVEGSEIIACHPSSVRVKIKKTKYKDLDVCLQFLEGYPQTPILVELKSRFLPEKLLEGLTKICDDKLKTMTGQFQILPLLKFIRQFLDDNPFTVCTDEISYIKKELIKQNDEIKLKQKAGVIVLTINQEEYYMKFKVSIPNLYPQEQIVIENLGNNYPELFQKMLIAQSTEIARQCVTPPIKKKPKDPPFEPKPSLKRVTDFLVRDGLRKFPSDICQVCKERAFPKDPKHVVNSPDHGRHVEWVYCGHLYHNGCLDQYMKTPPFTGGKKCLGCQKRIYHSKWNITPKLAEDRWAHEQARQRELDEVADFFE